MDEWTNGWMDGWVHVWMDGSIGRKIDVVVETISIIIVCEGAAQTGPRDEESKAVLPGRFKKTSIMLDKETLLLTTVKAIKHSKYSILQLLHLEERNMLQFRACFALSFQKLLGEGANSFKTVLQKGKKLL
jgi:hypothetical protein